VAARRAYEALDHFVIDQEGVGVIEPGGETRVLSNPLVQAELARQQRDLRELLDADEADEPSVVRRLRLRAEEDSKKFFV